MVSQHPKSGILAMHLLSADPPKPKIKGEHFSCQNGIFCIWISWHNKWSRFLVNEFLHEHHYSVTHQFDVSHDIQNSVEVSTYRINVSIDLMANLGYTFGLMLFLWPLMLICSYTLSHQVWNVCLILSHFELFSILSISIESSI